MLLGEGINNRFEWAELVSPRYQKLHSPVFSAGEILFEVKFLKMITLLVVNFFDIYCLQSLERLA